MAAIKYLEICVPKFKIVLKKSWLRLHETMSRRVALYLYNFAHSISAQTVSSVAL